MTRYAGLLLILFLLINLSCGYNSNITGEKNYTPPSQLNQPRLLYPKTAQENSNTGNTRVIFDIDKTGRVTNATIAKSSGSDVLDQSALEFCKSLIFDPAKINGRPVSSKMLKEFKFQISNMDMLASIYVYDVNRLYNILKNSGVSDRLFLEKKILHRHIEFVREMRDALNFNTYAAEVISPAVLKEWKGEWDSWPLSFLIFHDFIQRFPDYDSLQYVKNLMTRALKYDIKYIKNNHSTDYSSNIQNEKILSKIKSFIAVNYPDIKLDDFDTGGNSNDIPLSLVIKK